MQSWYKLILFAYLANLNHDMSLNTTCHQSDFLVQVAVIVRRKRTGTEIPDWLPKSVCLTTDAKVFFSQGCQLVVEAAGQESVRVYGERVLQGGMDFLVTSIGSLTDDALFEKLR